LFKNYTTSSVAELAPVVADVAALLTARTLLLLEGPVGAGKTELVKALNLHLGIAASASPSFAIHHRYENPITGVGVDHVDLYRLDGDDDLESTGFWDLFGVDRGLVVIEWADRLNLDLLPLNWTKILVQIEKPADPAVRTIRVSR
jgi:tRNA threonylcarbamoyladenosine biosynthesis protein TsaE